MTAPDRATAPTNVRDDARIANGIDGAENDAAVAFALGGAAVEPVRVVPRIDPVTGEVSGSGSGAGGGNAGEDHDDDHTAGSNTAK